MERRGLQVIVGVLTIALLVVLAAYDVSIGRNTAITAAVAPPASAPAEAPPPPPETAQSAPAAVPPTDAPPPPPDTQIAALPAETPRAATPPAPTVAPSFDVVRVEPSGDTVIAGEAPPDSKVEILDGTATIGTVDTDNSGAFALPLDKPLAPGTHDLALKATNKDATVALLSDQRVTVSVPEPPSKDVLVVVNTPDSASKVLESGAATAAASPPAATPPAAGSVATAPTATAAAPAVAAAAPAVAAAAPPVAEATPPATAAPPAVVAEASPTSPAQSAAGGAAPPAATGPSATAEATPPAAVTGSSETAPSSAATTAVANNSGASQEVASAPSAQSATTPANQTAAPSATGADQQIAEAALPKESPVTGEQPITGEPKIATEPPVQGEALIATEPPAIAKTEEPAAAPTPPPPPPQPSVTVAAVEADTAGNVYVAGTAATGETVRVYIDDQPLGDAKPSPSGTWLVQTKKDMPAGSYDVRVDQLGSDGSVIARAEVPFQREVDVAVLTPTGTASGATAGANVTAAMPPMETVIIKHGDNLWRIARGTWGKGMRWSTIYQANTDQIRNPHWIYPGQVFIMPKGSVTWTD